MQLSLADSVRDDQAQDLPQADCNLLSLGLTARWFEQLRTLRHRIQRWLPAVEGLPLWSYNGGDMVKTIDTLQQFLDELGVTIAQFSNPLAPFPHAAVETMDRKMQNVTRIARRLELALAEATVAA